MILDLKITNKKYQYFFFGGGINGHLIFFSYNQNVIINKISKMSKLLKLPLLKIKTYIAVLIKLNDFLSYEKPHQNHFPFHSHFPKKTIHHPHRLLFPPPRNPAFLLPLQKIT